MGRSQEGKLGRLLLLHTSPTLQAETWPGVEAASPSNRPGSKIHTWPGARTKAELCVNPVGPERLTGEPAQTQPALVLILLLFLTLSGCILPRNNFVQLDPDSSKLQHRSVHIRYIQLNVSPSYPEALSV